MSSNPILTDLSGQTASLPVTPSANTSQSAQSVPAPATQAPAQKPSLARSILHGALVALAGAQGFAQGYSKRSGPTMGDVMYDTRQQQAENQQAQQAAALKARQEQQEALKNASEIDKNHATAAESIANAFKTQTTLARHQLTDKAKAMEADAEQFAPADLAVATGVPWREAMPMIAQHPGWVAISDGVDDDGNRTVRIIDNQQPITINQSLANAMNADPQNTRKYKASDVIPAGIEAAAARMSYHRGQLAQARQLVKDKQQSIIDKNNAAAQKAAQAHEDAYHEWQADPLNYKKFRQLEQSIKSASGKGKNTGFMTMFAAYRMWLTALDKDPEALPTIGKMVSALFKSEGIDMPADLGKAIEKAPADMPRNSEGQVIGFQAPGAPTAQSRSRGQFSEAAVLDQIPTLFKDIDANSDDIGPLSGRINDIMIGKFGTNDPKYMRLYAGMHNLATAWMRLHANSENARQDFIALLSNVHTGDDLKAALLTINQQAKDYANIGAGRPDLSNPSKAVAAPAVKPIYASAPGKPRIMSTDGGKTWQPAPAQ